MGTSGLVGGTMEVLGRSHHGCCHMLSYPDSEVIFVRTISWTTQEIEIYQSRRMEPGGGARRTDREMQTCVDPSGCVIWVARGTVD